MKKNILRVFYLSLVGFCILFSDILLKKWVHYQLPLLGSGPTSYPYGGIPLLRDWFGIDFSINHLINTGAAWGIFASFSDYLLYFRLIALLFLMIFLFINKRRERELPVVFIFVGALGNVIDIFLYGHVIDMFYFVFWGYSYPVFNLADASICVGVFLLFFQSYFPKKCHASS